MSVDDELLVLARRSVVDLDPVLTRAGDNLATVELDGRDGEVVFKRVDDAARTEVPCLFENVKQGSTTNR